MSRTDLIADYFACHQNQWVSAYTLMDIAGKMAWRTRVSNARRRFNMTILNEVRRDASGVKESFYKYVPASVPAQARLWGAA